MTATTNPIQKLAIAILLLFSATTIAQITVDTSLTTQELVQDVLINGTCAETSNFLSFTGTAVSINGIGSFDASGTDFPFASGLVLTSGDVNAVPGPNLNTESSGGWPGDADLEAFTAATNTNDASWIQFDFVPLTEQLSFDFIMASEEYDQNFECTFSDAFAFILTDQTTGISENLAVLPGTNTPIEVTNIHPEVVGQCPAINEVFFDQYNFLPFNNENTAAINMNGQTVELTASTTVIVGNPYTIKLVVGDSGDTAFNMSVFIEEGSFNIGSTDLGENLLIASGNAPCEGDTIILDATDADATSYVWFLNDVEIAGETNPTLEVTEAGTYSVAVTLADLEDCVILDEITIEFITDDVVNLGEEDLEACEGDTITIDSGIPDNNATFVWLQDGTAIGGETSASLNITETGTYTIEATFNESCTFSDEVVVTFNTTPVLDLGEDINSCLLDPISLDATPGNVDPATVTYQWFLDGVAIAGATSATFDAAFPGLYTVQVTLDSCVGTDDVTITLANPDGTSCIMNDLCFDAQSIACGDVVVGNTDGATSNDDPGTCGTTSGAGGVWYTFTGTGDMIELALCNSDFDTKLQVFTGSCDALVCVDGNDDSCGLQSEVDFISDVGVEYFFYVFGFGTATGNYELQVSCVEPPPPAEECLDAMPFCSDDGLIFENTSDGTTAPDGIDYECLGSQPNPSWFFLEIATAGDLDLEIVQNTQFDENGNPIGNALDVDFIAWGPFTDPTEACTDLNPATSVDCSFSAAAVENFTIPNAQVGEVYIVLITNFNGSPGFISLGQTDGDGSTNCDILQEFTVDLGDDLIFCSSITPDYEIVPVITGDDLGDPTFLWSTGETTETITVSTSDTYSVEVTIDGFTVTEEIMITFLDDPCVVEPDCLVTSFEENFGTGTERVSTPFTSLIFNANTQISDGEYAITNTSDGLNFGWHTVFEDHTAGDVDGRALFVNADFDADEFYRRTVDGLLENEEYVFETWITTVYDTDTNICPETGIPSNVTLRVEDLAGVMLAEIQTGDIENEADFNWQLFSIGFNSGMNTSVQIVLINNGPGGCGNDLAIDDITLILSGTTPDIINGSDIDICFVADTLDLTTQINTILNGEDPTEVVVTYHTTQFDAEAGNNAIATPAAYMVTGAQTIYVRVERLNDPLCFSVATIELVEITPFVDLGEDQIICEDGSVTLFPMVDGSPSDFEYLWSTGETTETITVSASGTFSLTITSPGGCAATDAVIINIATPVVVNAGEDFITCRNLSSTITATVDTPDATLQWFLNDTLIEGATSSSLEFTPGETAFGIQQYTLVATSPLGCTSSDTVDVSLYDVGQCVITQGISPDNIDGLNDSLDLTFLADRTGIENLQIFNRHGRLIFEQTNYINEWRGQTDLSGNLLPTGTYFYVINFRGNDPEYGNQTSGWIYLNRAQ